MASRLASKLSLYMRAYDLPKKDKMSKTDGFVVVYLRNKAARGAGGDQEWKEVYRTTTIKDNYNPQWPEAAVIEYRFEEIQELRFEIYDRDSKNEDLKKQDFIGWYETKVSKIMGADGNTVSNRLYKKVKKKKKKLKFLKKAKFVVTGEEVAENKDLASFTFRAEKLDKKNMGGLGSADPFYVISNEQNGNYVRVFESEPLKKTRKPVWKNQRVPVTTLCNGDYDRKLRIDVFDWESNGNHKFIGNFETTLEELTKTKEFNLTNPSKKKKSSGTFFVDNCDIVDRSSFLDFIQGGCEMKLTVAVDFTGSNGHPSEKTSLHYLPPNFKYSKDTTQPSELNDYQKTLLAVGEIVQDYDSDRKIPVYGFGANLGNGPMDMHCFPLTLNPKKEEVKGVKGVMKAYQHSLKHVTLSGPTFFAPVINKVIGSTVDATQANQSYSVLLIITDGVINDMPKTIDAIIEASSKPISIIIVGLGDTDWTPMEALDGDGKKLSQNGKTVQRDIVQFVPYEKFKAQGYTSLAEEVLKEIPYQIESYFKQKKIKPNNKVPTPAEHYEPLPVLEMSDSEDDE